MRLIGKALLLVVVLFLAACNSGEDVTANAEKLPLFTSLSSSETGIDFRNTIEEDADHNCFRFDYMYNGGGVAVGDFDNDGIPDIFFTGNQVPNRLYFNRGDLKYEDHSAAAGIAAADRWCNGVSIVDINLDGLLDIYVCCAATEIYKLDPRNLLFINNGDKTFTESAEAYGLADPANSMQASFFDFDRDGDLDCYVANRPDQFHLSWAEKEKLWKNPPLESSNRLYENLGNGNYRDRTVESGLVSHDFSLGIVTGDITGDGWPDIYVSNDYEEPDHFYEYVGAGKFVDRLESHFRHTSNFGMGVDMADINNDALPDVVELDMVAKDNFRQKTNMSAMNPQEFWNSVEIGFHYQYMRNTLQLNQGGGLFSEIGQLSGISNTDWSWAGLFGDFNNDGWKDLIVTNGFRRDSRNSDFRKRFKKADEAANHHLDQETMLNLLNSIPVTKIPNYYFQNKGDLSFEDLSDSSGFAIPSFSNGAVYADLDNDGDLDVVVNNLMDPAFVYRNNTIQNGGTNFLKVKFRGPAKNPLGIGAKVKIDAGGVTQYHEMLTTRGYQSSVEPILHFGLGTQTKVERVEIIWTDGRKQVLKDVSVNKVLTVGHNDAEQGEDVGFPLKKLQLFRRTDPANNPAWTHKENLFDDYEREVLLPHSMSQFGPHISVGDVNQDGLEDFYIGGAKFSKGEMFIQQEDGSFKESTSSPWDIDQEKEDLGSVLFDFDGDGDLDLYVVSGGNESENSADYQDRLYVNNGGRFTKSSNVLPKITGSGMHISNADYDGDGDQDLFVGGRQSPGKYPYPGRSYLLRNDDGKFIDATAEMVPDLAEIGMVTDAAWTDFNSDGSLDLIVVGEWMPVKFFRNEGTRFKDISDDYGLENSAGWWFSITEGDVNKDGKPDYLLGNLGLNYKYKATPTEPFQIYASDFDENGHSDIVLGYFDGGKAYPVRGRQCSSQQIPDLQEKFPTYEEFGKATLKEVYGSALDVALEYNVREFGSCILLSKEEKYELKRLPVGAQLSPINDAISSDFDGDGNLDFLIAGNLYVSEVETGRADAGFGFLLKGDGTGGFETFSPVQTGFFAGEDAKDMAMIKGPNNKVKILVGNNRGVLQSYDFIGSAKIQ